MSALASGWMGSVPEPTAEVIVVAPHPDDEVLGAAGLMRWLSGIGARLAIVAVTDGEASHAASDRVDPDALRERRALERIAALRTLGIDAPVERLGLPDGAVVAHTDRLAQLLSARAHAGTTLIAPWRHDGHPDHEAVSAATLEAGGARERQVWEVPIWAKVRGPGLPRHSVLRLAEGDRASKAAAAACFTSQLHPHGPGRLRRPRRPPWRARVHARRPRGGGGRVSSPRAATSDDYFAEMWGQGDDPWEHATRWYEQRKYQITVAALPHARYRRSFEPGCGTGVLTRLLAERSDEHVAMERHPRGATATEERCRDLGNVTVEVGAIPRDWIAGTVDLIVLSEVLYYLDDDQLSVTIDRSLGSLCEGGTLVAVHYRADVEQHTWNGDEVHDRLQLDPRWDRPLSLRDDGFRLDVLVARP